MYAEVAPNVSQVTGTFHYAVPDDWPAGTLRAGHLVEAPFGRQRVQAIVVALSEEPPAGLPSLKELGSLLDNEPVLTPAQLDLAYWLAHHEQTPLLNCLTLMLPPGLSKKADMLFVLPDLDIDPDDAANTPAQTRVLKALIKADGALRGRQLNRRYRKALPGWRNAANQLVQRDVLRRIPVLAPPAVSPKRVRTVTLAVSPERLLLAKARLTTGTQRHRLLTYLLTVAPAQPTRGELVAFLPDVSERQLDLAQQEDWIVIDDDGRVQLARSLAETRAAVRAVDKPNRRIAVLDFLLQEEGGPLEVSWVYAETGANLSDLRTLAEHGFVHLGEHELLRDPLQDVDFTPADPPPLTVAQTDAWRAIQRELRAPVAGTAPRPFLLHGVTGSGKTEIYMRAVHEVIERGQQALVLVPEIALTPQTVRRFLARFPGRVSIWHSELSDGERYDTWRRARAGRTDVIVGVRSALFAPLPDIGLIVLDEEHDESYKQSPNSDFDARPYYHARETAVAYARILGAAVILGSATPDLVSYDRAAKGDYQLLELPNRIMGHRQKIDVQAKHFAVTSAYHASDDADAPDARYIDMPRVRVIDMRQELRAGNRTMFSRALSDGIERALARDEQVILFLNRRGSATYVFCRDCGYTHECPNCGTPMSHHSHSDTLICHHCNTRRKTPVNCPNCNSERIRFFGAGTQRVEQAVQQAFPRAVTLRWDRDTTRERNAHALILNHFANRQSNVLIGTQMVAKGLDLPLVTLVGVINADVGLALPDFRAGERTFQLLTQVAGRAGRGIRGGQAIFQTYMPDHYAIQAAAHHDYGAFFAAEMRYRREQVYPPVSRLVRVVVQHGNPRRAEDLAMKAAAQLRQLVREQSAASTTLIGPAPCFFGRVRGDYRWHVILRGPNPSRLLTHLQVPPDWQVEIDPLSLL